MAPSSPPTAVSLRQARPQDRAAVFQWLVDAHQGPFFCTEEPPPTWSQFGVDYNDLFFDHSSPRDGGLFIITQSALDIGAVSYDARFRRPGEVDLDIWLAHEELCGQGRGPAALAIMADMLTKTMGFNRLLISPCRRNTRAVRAYEKAGFQKLDLGWEEMQARYGPLDCSHAQVMVLEV